MSNTDGLERIQPADKNSKVRVALLADVVKPKMAWMHFIQDSEGKKRSYRCLSKRDKKHVITEMGDCCKKLNGDDDQKAQLNFAVLAVKYINADPKTGKYENAYTPIRYEIGCVSGNSIRGRLMETDPFRAVVGIGARDKVSLALDMTTAKETQAKRRLVTLQVDFDRF